MAGLSGSDLNSSTVTPSWFVVTGQWRWVRAIIEGWRCWGLWVLFLNPFSLTGSYSQLQNCHVRKTGYVLEMNGLDNSHEPQVNVLVSKNKLWLSSFSGLLVHVLRFSSLDGFCAWISWRSLPVCKKSWKSWGYDLFSCSRKLHRLPSHNTHGDWLQRDCMGFCLNYTQKRTILLKGNGNFGSVAFLSRFASWPER